MDKRLKKIAIGELEEIRAFNDILFGLLPDDGFIEWRLITGFDKINNRVVLLDLKVKLPKNTQQVTIDEASEIAHEPRNIENGYYIYIAADADYYKGIKAIHQALDEIYMNAYETIKTIHNAESQKYLNRVIDDIWEYPFSVINNL